MLVRARRGPGVVRGVDRDAGLALPGELPRYRRSEGVDAVDEQRVDIRLDGVQIGRQEQARALRPHLVNVVDDLRRSEEHTSELQALRHLVCRLLLEKKK